MTIKVLKLVTGEEVVVGVEENLNGVTSYSKPRTFLTQQTSSGLGAALVPWIWSAPDATVQIKGDHILAVAEVSKQLEDSYLQHTSGIEIASKL